MSTFVARFSGFYLSAAPKPGQKARGRENSSFPTAYPRLRTPENCRFCRNTFKNPVQPRKNVLIFNVNQNIFLRRKPWQNSLRIKTI